MREASEVDRHGGDKPPRYVSSASIRAWVPALGLLLALSVAAAVADRTAPPGLLRAAQHPYPSRGDTRVRTGSLEYPRWAIGADGVELTLNAAPVRIASDQLSIDEFLYAIVAPERMVGVNETSYVPTFSNVYEQLKPFKPAVVGTTGGTEVEAVLRANPDLFFGSFNARADVPELLRTAGVPVYRMYTDFTRLDEIEDHIRLIGYLTGADARAEAAALRFRTAIARAAAKRPQGQAPPRVLGLGGTYTYGSETLFNDICRVLGATNVAATHGLRNYDGIGSEQIVRWDPDWIVTGAPVGQTQQTLARLLADPAIATTQAAARGQIVVLEYPVFLPLSPYTTRLVEAMATALYGGEHL
jgi:iron complex transport system substrate-binding protein